jgi:hypothetical protein
LLAFVIVLLIVCFGPTKSVDTPGIRQNCFDSPTSLSGNHW